MSEMKPMQNSSNESNARLKAAVNSVEVPPFLDAKIRRQIQDLAKPRRRWAMLVPVGAVAGLAIAAGLVYELSGLRQAAEQQESFIAAVSAKVSTLMRVGLGDHIHCAFFRKFPAEAPAAEEIKSELGAEYKNLADTVRKHVPAEYKLVLGHQCRYNGRTFVHLSLKSDTRLLSLVVTAKKRRESFDISGALPALVQSGIPMYADTTDRFQIAAIETSSHLVYFISDLPHEENMQLMQAMAPSLKSILESIHG